MKPIVTVPLEIKSLSNREFEGHGSVFGNVDLGGDIVMPGAFSKSLEEHAQEGSLPQMFWMHDPSRVPGKWLSMSEDDDGLVVKGILADTDLGNEIHTLLKMDAVRGLSIGYVTTDQDYDKAGHRLIKEADLWEVSVVSLPMNPKAKIQHVKSRLSAAGEYVPRDDEMAQIKRECERFLRDKGFSRKMATKYVANLFNDSGVTPEPKSEPAEKADSTDDGREILTPDEIELNAGIEAFKDREMERELTKRLDRIFKAS